MIVKEKHGEVPTDKFGKAGFKAEKQMAYFLQVAFKDSDDVFVFNDVRFEHNGETAQIDHLVLHRFGFFLIESKSVSTRIEVNKKLEFVRVFNGKRQGMASPINQVKRQAELIAKLLNENREVLRRKMMFGLKQAYFGDDRFELLVAISDQGEIARKGCDPPELMKADAIVAKIRERVEKRKSLTGFKGALQHALAGKAESREMEKEYLAKLTDEELVAIRKFLMANHQPFGTAQSEVTSPTDLEIAEIATDTADTGDRAKGPHKHSCRLCDSANLKVVYGQYGYYFTCSNCGGNTRIDFTCVCGDKAKISKRGLRFNWKCHCGNSSLFFENFE